MRVSIVNCVSTAATMMRFSDASLFQNAGHDDFDYIVVKWLASPEVEEYLAELPDIARRYCPAAEVHVIDHPTRPHLGYVPNLRAMMNEGFEACFRLNEYCGLTNTDVYHGTDWLRGLVDVQKPQRVTNSLHITAVPLEAMNYQKRGIINQDLGVPLPGRFDQTGFDTLYRQHCVPCGVVTVEAVQGPGGYRQLATMPYLFHRKYWRECGPWDTVFDWQHHFPSPDEVFFDRVHAAGAEFVLALGSVIYHAEGVERNGPRPKGADHLPNEGFCVCPDIKDDSTVLGTLDGVNPHLITVGHHCVVGTNAALLTHCPIRGALPVVLDDYVWIGYGALVLPGVTIGECTVIGAGSVVARDIPSGVIAAGNPARVLRLLTDPERMDLKQKLTNHSPMGKDPALEGAAQ